MLDTSYLKHQHHQCAWCGRLIHKTDHSPHGQKFDNLAYLIHRGEDRGYSHGACCVCKARLLGSIKSAASGRGTVHAVAA